MVADEVVVYDLKTQQAHALPTFVARVRDLADGTRTVKEIAAAMRSEGVEEAQTDAVWTALDSLGDADLLKIRATPPAGISRRSAIRRLAAASAIGAFPFVVQSIAMPKPASAQSAGGGEGEKTKVGEETQKEQGSKEEIQKGIEQNQKGEQSAKEGIQKSLEQGQKEAQKPV